MNAISTDLWPDDIGAGSIVTPVSILKVQAATLGSKTKNLVEGKVSTGQNGRIFYHTFKILAPALGNYTYELLTVNHSIELYPVNIIFEGRASKADTAEAFVEALRGIFSNEKTKRVIESLISQSRETNP